MKAAFTLHDAAELLDYLRRLGVDWLYLSPVLQSQHGSSHGYDTSDPRGVDEERGGADALRRLADAAHARSMGLLADIVPNHLGVDDASQNPWWWDVLRQGRLSSCAGLFDIDWEGADDRVVLPVLPEGGRPGLRLEDGELRQGDSQRFPVDPASYREEASADDPAALYRHQHYRLVPWTDGDELVNYRRFFAVNSLAAVREELPWVFEAMHGTVSGWFEDGIVDGLRVDHPDGLLDPAGYVRRLREATGTDYLVVEKILESGEQLPAWDCEGTTGYDALSAIDRLFVDPSGEPALTALAHRLTPEIPDWPTLVLECKLDVARTLLRQEVRRIARDSGVERPGVEQPETVQDAVVLLLACLPVYRSYLPVGAELLEAAFARAEALRPQLAATLEALRPVLSDPEHPAAQRFQQTSGAVMAKGVEDRAFYRFTRLTSLTEVGGDPDHFAHSPREFAEAAKARGETWPHAMTALSTHDTKRSEDVRARLAVLAEVPDEWAARLERWRSALPTGDGSLDNLVWQALVGAWPIERERMQAYALKAAREAGNSTNWLHPDEGFEQELAAVIDGVFDDSSVRGDVTGFAKTITEPGWSNSLGAKLVQLTMPGVPDVYQGSELWEFSLVDPDNRRQVDFEARDRLLASLDAPGAALPAIDESGAAKLLVTSRALRLRRDRPELFGGCEVVTASGPAAEHLIAFDCGPVDEDGGAVTLATRLPVRLERRGGWADTDLVLPHCAGGRWRDAVTGRQFGVGRALVSGVFEFYPVALLVPDEGGTA